MTQHLNDSTDLPPDEDTGEALPVVELETLLNRPPSWRKRLVQIGLALVTLVVVLITFRNSIIPRQQVPQFIHMQPPTFPPPTLSIQSNVTYGTITINGQVLHGSPRSIYMRSQPPYTITLAAPPFRTRTCHFPSSADQTPGAFSPCADSGGIMINQQAENILELLFTLADLPPDQQQQITALIPRAITTQQTITAPAGSPIITSLGDDGTFKARRISGPLSATAFLVPMPAASASSDQPGNSCQGFICVQNYNSGLLPNDSLNGNYWQVQVSIALRWRFTTASGQVVSDVTFPVTYPPLTLFLSYDAATGWSVALLPPWVLSQDLTQLVCSTGAQMVGVEQARYLSGEGWDVTVLHDHGLAGCLLELTQNGADQGHFVWRFGALLAADAQARATLPMLPVASPADLAAVGE